MWKTLVFAVALGFCPIVTQAWFASRVDTVDTRYPDGQIKEQYQTLYWDGNESTTKTGFYRSWYPNGNLEWDGNYYADLKVDTWVRWDSSGFRAEEISYVAGDKHGAEIEWNPNGTIRKRLHYREGKLNGLCSWKLKTSTYDGLLNNPNLCTEKEDFYIDGDLIVPITEEIHQSIDGDPCQSSLSPYYNSEHDIWIEWKTQVCKFYVGKQVEGKKQGHWILWSKAGELLRVDIYEGGVLLKFE